MYLVQRVKNILLQPKQEWQVIDGEATSAADLYKSYIVPLAAIGPLASIIGMAVVGLSMPFVGTYRVPLGMAASHAVVSYILTLLSVFLLALVINALAPTFGGRKEQNQALKVAAYASTPSWLAGIFMLLPALGFLGLLASLYGLYLLYLGLPVLMKTPPDKALGYTVVVVIVAIVIFMIFGAVSSALIAYPTPEMPMPGTGPGMD
ncbi:Yip1 family protein [Thermithiobacillus tepidarius DSM 3134]|uniref:Yip1 family protein n=1 Tax=Thermithiobacillus tepidarius TaxID=929 RepID=UPI0004119CFB|nr:Yip1 family protein [Thermithiobacillus tepidarius]